MRVLVVSQDIQERQRATSALAQSAAVVIVEVDSAKAARLALEAATVDVLVIDGDLTPKGGFSLLYEVRADAQLLGERQIPALVLVERAADQWLAKWARADATLPKPVDPFAVARIVGELVGQPEPA